MHAASDTVSSISDLASYCKATADQQRLTILRALSRESFGVLELCHILDMAQPAMSHHLKILNSAGLVETRREGTSIYYRRALVHTDDPIRDLRHSLFATVDQTELSAAVQHRLNEINTARNEQARDFFAKNADRFQENQDLIAAYEHYASCVSDLLDNESLDADSAVIEVGPGESDLIIELHRRFSSVTGIDTSPQMLARTQANLAAHGIADIELFNGDLANYDGLSDLIVLNMVLHHIASPASFFRTAHDRLKPGGKLLIADLTAHDQDWTRSACGDQWLGFDPAELDNWSADAGFTQGQSAYLGLKNGFQVQVRIFHKS